MTQQRPELWTLLDGMQMDIRAANAKLVAIRSLAAGLNLAPAEKTICPQCRIPLRGPRTLAEHLHVVHDMSTAAEVSS